ncbi:MAG: leucine-rich repeat domain-containing protein, partial [Candidatus Cloacimonetes bacterium]|nr:leucine-rich repeat domain-containing protein [Candidatus Cloacimonadota bacterium]MCB5286079.1 leucine-rich repeat domain-containing protein [Candidatus Cloacimonadota bacterium]MDY0368106.1 leucine-rich repeat domain-containing protein [Candidatus Syntrophosphaera sp.]MDY0368118.1 leucine-rich repeat domain-containing protein [Candidatus Syntrophosphaera sp.]
MNCKSYVAIIIAAAVCMMPALALVEDTTADGLVEGYTTIDGITYKCCLDGDVRTAFITGYDGTLADTDGDGAADGVHIPGSVEHGGNTYSVTDVPKSLFNGTGDTSYRNLGNLVIGEGIVRVPSEAFMFCNIDSISFPSTLEVIGSKAFFRSTGFSEVMLNDGLVTLGPSSFSGTSVEKVYVPGSVHINVSETNTEGKVDYGSAYIFTGCDSLREVILGEGLNAIGYKMFGECKSLGTVAIPASVETIDGWAFRHSSATVTFADGCSLAEIGISAFLGKTNDDTSAPTV